MAANIFTLTAAHSGGSFPLRGDMSVALDFVPTQNFFVTFVTKDAGTFDVASTVQPIERPDGTVGSSFSIGGQRNLFVKLMYDTAAERWTITQTNLVTLGTTGGGTGGTYTPAYMTGGLVAQYWGKTGSADGQVGWLTLPTGTGGTGTGSGTGATAEVLLTQNEAGEITPVKALGNRFRVMITKPVIIKNPEGYEPGEDIAVALRQNELGPHPWEFGNAYAFKDRQPPAAPSQPSALVEIFARLTADIDAGNKGGWMTRITPDASVVGYGVASFIARNVTTGVSYYVLRSATQPSGMTAMKPGETLKILRNGLGIEAYGGIDSTNGAGSFLITGALPNGNRAELRTGPGVRSAYDKGVLAFSAGNVTAQDIIVSGAREQSGGAHIAQGVSVSGTANVTLKNVKAYDNENGILTANDYSGTLQIIDCEFDGNGVGQDFGYVHNIYAGHHAVGWSALRSTFKNCVGGHNIKTRSAITTLDQVLCQNSRAAREFEAPNGGRVYATNCVFEHYADASQNDCVRIGAEGIDTARAREYIFRNCHFRNDKDAANQGSYVWNDDPDVDVFLIDCTFEGATQWSGTNAQGNRGRVIVQFTPGVTAGPLLPVGYQPIAVTPVAG